MLLKVLQTSQENTSVEFLIKKLDAEEKRLQHSCLSVRFAKFLRTTFFYKTLLVNASAPQVASSYFFKKVIKQLFRNLVVRY